MTDAKSLFAKSARGAPRRRARTVGLTAALAAVVALAICSSPALAVDTGHAYSFSFAGSGTDAVGNNLGAIAVDNSNGPSKGDVYVADNANNRIDKFGPNGNFILMFGSDVNATTQGDICTAASGNTCQTGISGDESGQFSNLNKMTIDQTGGPSAGDIYIATNESRIAKYDENGALITAWGSSGYLNGTTSEGGSFSSFYGIAVDSAGRLLVATGFGPPRVVRFSESGAFVSEFGLDFGPSAGFGWSPQGYDYFNGGEHGSIKRASDSAASSSVWVSEFLYPEQLVYGRQIAVDTSDGTVVGTEEHFDESGETNLFEWKFNGSGQPLESSGNPCPTTLTLEGEGCPATHEFGSGFAKDGPTAIGAQGAIALNTSNGSLYATSTYNEYSQGKINVYVEAPAALAVTEGPVAKKTVSGAAKPDGAGEITECRFEFGATKSYGSSQACGPGAPYASDQVVTAELPISNENAYHYRLVVKNAAGAVSFGADRTISPHNVEGLETLEAENVTRTTAKLKAKFDGNGEPTNYYFEWTGGPAPETSATPPGPSAGSPSFPPASELEFEATGLKPQTEYHYKVVAENGEEGGHGKTVGNERTFETLPAVHSVTTDAANPVERRSATLHGSFVGDGTDTTYTFEWGKTTAYGNSTTVTDAGSPSILTQVSAPVTGLELETTYHYRLVATNPLGSTDGNDETLTTLPALTGVVTKAATDIGQEKITLNGEFTGNGEATSFYFEYGLTTAYGQKAPAQPEDAGTPAVGVVTQVSAPITEYEGYSTYHYRLVAANSFGETRGSDMTVETLPTPLPSISGTESSGVEPTGATLEAQVNPNRAATVYLFEYGPNSSYGESTEIGDSIGADNTAHAVSSTIANLTPSSVYHYRVVAVNFTGTALGPDQTFLTPDVPKIQFTEATSVSGSGAHLSAVVLPSSSSTTAHFEYGTTTFYGTSTPDVSIGSDTATHPLAADLSGLVAGTTYHYRVVAGNAFGTVTGPDGTFTTAGAGPPGEEEPVKPKPCKKRLVRRHGKCVKKKPHHKKHHRHSTRRHG